MSLSQEQIEVLLHTSRTGRYVTGELLVIQMAQSGLLYDHGPQKLAGGDHYFTMTVRGREVLSEHLASLPKPPPITKRQSRAKERYRRWLDYGDCFRSFLDFCYWDAEKQRERRLGL